MKNFLDNQVPADPGITWNVPGMPDGLYYALGDAGYAVLDMGAPVANQAGDDVTITGSASAPSDGFELLCSTTPDGPWASLGTGSSTGRFDLGGVTAARDFRVVDNGGGPGGIAGAGFGLDALTAVSSPAAVEAAEALEPQIRAYPNPTSGLLCFAALRPSGGRPSVSVFDQAGRLLVQETASQPSADRWSVDLSALATGTYFLRIQTDRMTETRKVAVLR